MREKRFLCDLLEEDDGKKTFVSIIPIAYVIAFIIACVVYALNGNLTVGNIFMSFLVFGNLGWIVFLLISFVIILPLSRIYKAIYNWFNK